MSKKLVITILSMWFAQSGFTQTVPSFRMPQHSMGAVHPTALPYNQFDKIDVDERTSNNDRNKKLRLKYFFNMSTRFGVMENWQSSTQSSYEGAFEATSFSFDYMPNHEFAVDGKADRRLLSKWGIGILRYDWQNLQMTIPYVNGSAVYPLNQTGSKGGDLKVAVGGAIRCNAFKSAPVRYLDSLDPDIPYLENENRAGKSAFAFSVALFNIKRFYAGIGYNFVNGFAATSTGISKEINFLAQYAWGKPQGEDKQRAKWGHHHSSLVFYKLLKEQKDYPLYLQVNHRWTMADLWWIGLGIGGHPRETDTLGKLQMNKWQGQVGFLKPKNITMKSNSYDLHWWLTFNYDTSILRQHGIDFNIGIAL